VLIVDVDGGAVPTSADVIVDTTVDGRARARFSYVAFEPPTELDGRLRFAGAPVDASPVELRLAALGHRAAAAAATALRRWHDGVSDAGGSDAGGSDAGGSDAGVSDAGRGVS
jgi:hypothetical protein